MRPKRDGKSSAQKEEGVFKGPGKKLTICSALALPMTEHF